MDRTKLQSKKWFRISVIVSVILAFGAAVYIWSFYHSLSKSFKTMHHPIERKVSEKRQEEVILETKEPFSVLVLGVDERKGDKGRSDTMIVLTVNGETKSVKMLSIPRDTRTTIIGNGTIDKINHAYAFGGVEMSINTVEAFLDIPIDYFIQINMEGFRDIVDALGGVTVYNDLEFQYNGYHFPKGEVTLNGDEALVFSRMRYEDPRGDFGRQLRQRQIIKAIIKEGASLSSLTNYKSIFAALGKNIRTNLTFNEIVDIQQHYKEAGKQIDQLQMDGSGKMIDEIYFFIVPEEEQQRIRNELKEHLEL